MLTRERHYNMAKRQMENQEPAELNQLENQLNDIQGEINRLLMAPRQEKDVKKLVNNSANDDDFVDDELEGELLCVFASPSMLGL